PWLPSRCLPEAGSCPGGSRGFVDDHYTRGGLAAVERCHRRECAVTNGEGVDAERTRTADEQQCAGVVDRHLVGIVCHRHPAAGGGCQDTRRAVEAENRAVTAHEARREQELPRRIDYNGIGLATDREGRSADRCQGSG